MRRLHEEVGPGEVPIAAKESAQAIYREGAKLVAAGHNPMNIKRGFDRAVEQVVESLKARAKPTKGPKEIAQGGAISANGDQEIGDKLAEARAKVGKEGVITVEESRTAETTATIGRSPSRRSRVRSGPLRTYFRR